jgi:hypothetical protein
MGVTSRCLSLRLGAGYGHVWQQQTADVTRYEKGSGMKLFRSTKYPTRWFAFGPEIGWVMFPAEVGGWQKRQPARGIDPIDVREVPLRTGLKLTRYRTRRFRVENPVLGIGQ